MKLSFYPHLLCTLETLIAVRRRRTALPRASFQGVSIFVKVIQEHLLQHLILNSSTINGNIPTVARDALLH